MPRIFPTPQNPRVQLEHGFTLSCCARSAPWIRAHAARAGYARLYLIVRRGNVWVGVADTRHDGQPKGY